MNILDPIRAITFALSFVSMVSILSPVWAGETKPAATLHKTPECGCCEGYADYLRQNGYDVAVKSSPELSQLKRTLGVPEEIEGCHTTLIDGYVFEGHVPINAVNRLLTERPKIIGISLPGMPQGSPGMSGDKQAPFTIYEIGSEKPKVFSVE